MAIQLSKVLSLYTPGFPHRDLVKDLSAEVSGLPRAGVDKQICGRDHDWWVARVAQPLQ
jgi:hypothetical protein